MPLHLFKPALAPLVLRLGLAAILLYHGLLKLSEHGGGTWSNLASIPTEVQVAVTWVEIVGGLMIALGALTRPAAFAILVVQIGAIALVTWHHDFISLRRLERGPGLYRYGDVGWEYNFALSIMCVTLILLGSGIWSVNNVFLSWFRGSRTVPTSVGDVPAPIASPGEAPAPATVSRP